MRPDYEMVIGLEVHVQLLTNSKIFCSCRSRFGDAPNANTCPVCLGLPGALPVFNRKVLDYGIKVGLALNSQIAARMKFDRKNYFYPDLPKAYQISQFDMPLAAGGFIEIKVGDNSKKIGITRAHVEEDAGKLLHEGIQDGSHVDYNRGGTPLIEIVSEPDIASPEEAYQYLTNLKAILQYLEVSDCNMEEGSLRCDANVSVRKKGETKLGTKTEIKNLNSFKAVAKAIQYEADRQQEILEDGGKVTQETRLWDDNKGQTRPMRSKEKAHDYRYFPEPDLVPFAISQQTIASVRESMPELPHERKKRFMTQFQISDYDASVLIQEKSLADYYERTVKAGAEPKASCNWITNELLAQMKAKSLSLSQVKITPESLSGLLKLIQEGTISGKIAKDVFLEMLETNKAASVIVQEKGLSQISDTGQIESIIEKVLAENPKSVQDFQSGKQNALGFLVGQVMRQTQGKANPAIVNQLLKSKLASS